MKYLILFILIACAEPKEPGFLDLKDDDGDQVLNHKEVDIEKNLAKIVTIGAIKGVLRFRNGQTWELPFSNETDLKKKAFDIATSSFKIEKNEDYFSEWSKLKLKIHPEIRLLESSLYMVELDFESAQERPSDIILRHEKETIHLGDWGPSMKFNLSKEQLEDLLSGKASFELRNKNPDEIQEKTYRVYFSDGSTSQIFYVSKNFAFAQFLQYKEITNYEFINEDDLFYLSNLVSINNWWRRDFANGDKVIIFGRHQELSKHFLARLSKKSQVLERFNGVPANPVQITKAPDALVYLKIRPVKTNRTFVNSVTTQRFGTGGGREGDNSKWTCYYYHTLINTEENFPVEQQEFFDNLSILSGGENLKSSIEDFKFIQESDELGLYWNLKLNYAVSEFELRLKQLPPQSYVTGGHHRTECPSGEPGGKQPSPVQINPEGKLSFEIESFIEKIE